MRYVYRFKDRGDKKIAMATLKENDTITELDEDRVRKVLPKIEFDLVGKRGTKWSEVLEKLIGNIVEAMHFPP